jgi:sulfur dioxygenase
MEPFTMLFRQLFDPETSTYTYLLADAVTREAILIDPVLDQIERDARLLHELGLELRYALDTHVHADHVTAAGALRDRLGARTVIARRAGVGCADLQVGDGDVIRFGGHGVRALETPGPTAGCLSYLTLDRQRVFTGDALLIRGCGRTDFQGGDPEQLYRSIHDQLFALPGATLIYPGHDYHGRTASSIDEERRHNPRLGGGATCAEFTRIMRGLTMPRPRLIDVALPRNVRCGRPAPAGPAGDPATDPDGSPGPP